MSMIVIGDIHGCFDTFLELIKQFPEDSRICLVGDLIDRGPKSRQVVEYVIENKIDCVKGNHEVMMYEQPDYWTLNGGMDTLESYSTDNGTEHLQLDKDLFTKHKKWMKELPVYIEYPEIKNEEGRYLVISHSLIHNVWKHRNNPDRINIFEKTTMWTRDFAGIKDNPEIFNIIGHTPQKYTPHATKIYANVDTGCCYDKYEEHGIMSAIQYPEMIVYKQKNIEKIVDNN